MAKYFDVLVGRCPRNVLGRVPPTIVFLALGLLCGGTAEALEMTKAEYDLLPAYCRNQNFVARKYFRPDSVGKWKQRFGYNNYNHIHHYCWGMVSIIRSYRAGQTEQLRRYELTVAVDDILFSINASTPDFELLPEMYTKLGVAYLGLRDDKNAAIAFTNAWTANPAYWPPYVWWAERLLKLGKRDEALAVAEEGKKNAPDSKPLNNLIEEIKGRGKAARN